MESFSWRQTFVVAVVIVVAAFAAGQLYEGAGVVVALIGSLGWTAYVVGRSRPRPN